VCVCVCVCVCVRMCGWGTDCDWGTWMGHGLRMDEDSLPRQVFDCSFARSVAEDGRVWSLS